MKKILSLSVLLVATMALAQPNIENLQKQFDSLNKSTVYGRNEKVGKYYDINGFKMYCEVYGKGEPLLLIHGNGGSINNFVKQIPYFSKKYQVIVADSRSQGKSTDKGSALTYEMMADDYAALLTKLNVEAANVIGWSDGGINGLLLAIRHPDKVKKLIVTGANLRPDHTAVEDDVLSIVDNPYQMLKRKTDKTEEDKTVYKLLKLLVEQPNIPVADLRKIKSPVLVIGGDHDVIKPKHTLEIFENINEAYLWILPNSGHSTLAAYTEEFNRKVSDFLTAPYRKITGTGRFF